MLKMFSFVLFMLMVCGAGAQSAASANISVGIVNGVGTTKEANMQSGNILFTEQTITLIIGTTQQQFSPFIINSGLRQSSQVAILNIINNASVAYDIMLPESLDLRRSQKDVFKVSRFVVDRNNHDQNEYLQIGATILLRASRKIKEDLSGNFPVVINFN